MDGPLVPNSVAFAVIPCGAASSFTFANARLKFVPQYFCGACDPIAIARERCNAGETAATGRVTRASRPAHHADDQCPLGFEAKNRRARISRAGAKALLFAARCGIKEADL